MSKALPVEKMDSALNPVRLIIPAIAINASVEDVGAQANADLATPSQNPWLDVGWYNLGPRPGERGSAVIDGHLDRPGGFPAVFWYLRDLHVGDKVLVKNTSGEKIRFQVTRIELLCAARCANPGHFRQLGRYVTQFNHLRRGLDSESASDEPAASGLYVFSEGVIHE